MNFTKKRSRIALVIIFVAILCGLALTWLFTREPSYQGKRLSVWINDLNDEKPEVRQKAAVAIRHIGVSAVPTVVQLLRSEDSPSKLNLIALVNKQSLIKIQFTPALQKRQLGLMACDALGPVAQAAVPTLSKLFHCANPDPRAAFAIARVGGPEAIRSLTHSLTSTNKFIRLNASTCLDLIRSKSGLLEPDKTTSIEVSDYMRRNCEYNLCVLQAAFRDGVASGLIHVNDRPPATPMNEFLPALTNNFPKRIIPTISPNPSATSTPAQYPPPNFIYKSPPLFDQEPGPGLAPFKNVDPKVTTKDIAK